MMKLVSSGVFGVAVELWWAARLYGDQKIIPDASEGIKR